MVQGAEPNLRAEHARRREIAEPVMSSKDRNPVVIEAQRAVEYAERLANRVLWASDGKTGTQQARKLPDRAG